jgi:AsmA-like C-terminal region/AsmA family
MKRSSRILAVLGALVAVVLLLLLGLPLLLRNQIQQRVKTAVNESLDARVDWWDLGLTFFRNFPNVTLTLDGLTAVGLGRFQGDTLASVGHLRLVLDLASVPGGVLHGKPIIIRAAELEHPRLSLIALEDGTANWDIAKKSPESREPQAKARKPMAISLSRLEISDGDIAFENRKARLKATLNGYDLSLTGDFSRDLVAIRTRANADTVSLTFAGIPYLNRVKLALTADVQADLEKKSYTLHDTGIRLNDLTLGVSGSATSAGKNMGLDLTFNAPSTKFRDILSLVPAVYAHDFQKVKTTGSIAVNGRVKGEYGDSAFPSLALNAKVDSAAFQYPDLPLPARDIALDLAISNPGGSADSTVVRLQALHLLIGRNPIDARMVLQTPISDPDVDLRVSGRVDLADVRRTLKLEGINQLAGTVAADVAVRTRMSFIDRKQYDKVAASGTVDIGNLTVEGKDLPHPLAIQQASLRLAPEKAQLRSFQGIIGSSDLRASGTLLNPIAFAMRDDTLRGIATVQSKQFNLDEWQSGGTGVERVIPVPPRVDFDLNATVAELLYHKLRMTNARGHLRVKDQRLTLEDFRMNALGGEIGLKGFYETTNQAKPNFDVGLTMTKVDVPSAFQAFTTVKMLAPVARYAVGNVTTDLHLTGALSTDMMPLFQSLTGKGSFQTSPLLMKGFPAFDQIAGLTKMQFLANPTLQALRVAFQIRDGRLFVDPFAVKLGGTTMNVSGSNGFDQSLQYNLTFRVPRSALGGDADQALAGLLSKAGKAGLDLKAAPEIALGIKLGGTVTSPTVAPDVGSLASSLTQGAEQAVRQAVKEKVDTVAARLDQETQQRAAAIRQEAESLAARVKQEGYRQADSLIAKASNPVLKAAAEPAANELRKQSDAKAAGIITEANQRADSLIAQARRRGQGSP